MIEKARPTAGGSDPGEDRVIGRMCIGAKAKRQAPTLRSVPPRGLSANGISRSKKSPLRKIAARASGVLRVLQYGRCEPRWDLREGATTRNVGSTTKGHSDSPHDAE